MHSYQQYKGRRVAKLFPAHGDQPFKGVVKKATDNAKDGLPFFIQYDDGDKEWISLEELESILVDEEGQETGTGKQRKGGSASRSGGKGAGRKRKASAGEDGEAAAATATNTNGTPATAAAARASQGAHGTASQPSAKRGSAAAAKHTPAAVLTAAAAKDGAAGASSSKPGKKPNSAAAAAAVSAGGAASDANASPSRLLKQGLGLASRAVAAVVGRAMQDDGAKTEQQQQRKPQASASAGGPPQRSTYTGPGAAGMPSTSSFVRAGGHVYLTLSSSPSAPWPGGPVDYSLEVQQVLGDLEHSLGEVSSSKRRLLTVRIYFRDINAGLQKFTPLWNEWVDSETLPVLTLVEGAGMAGSSVTLEAVALASSSGSAATD